MSEFTKLGGYLIEGQPEVAHDNTLSGNGLEGSPLGISEQVSEANDLVHSNSGTWNGVSAKLDTTASANFYTTANESGFITGVPEGYATTGDLTAYQTTAGMTAYQSAGDYYSASNPSGFISEVPAGTMNESAFEYNGSNKISAYNGSAFAGGGGTDLDFGYDESGAISSINTSALSDSRAGTPLYVEAPLFTGQSGESAYIGWQGYNETKLWVSEYPSGSNIQTFNLNEPYTSFERIKIYFHINDGDAGCAECLTANTCVDAITMANYSPASPGTDIAKALRYYLVNDNQITAAPSAMFKPMNATAVNHESYTVFYVQEIIGVNRK